MDAESHYWTYWVHRIQELWREHEKLERRVADLERQLGGAAPQAERAPAARPSAAPAQPAPQTGRPAAEPVPAPALAQAGAPSPLAEDSEGARELAPPAEAALKEMELSACMALKELGGEASVHEINAQLAKSRSIKEEAKTTLMRLRGAVQKGYVSMDATTKRFKLLRDRFVVG